MPTENELIKKTYYQSVIDNNEKEHPIHILGDMYMEEMKKERPDLSSIRFAQGEVYFLNKDYEAAISKWQYPLNEELLSWAQKNIADAQMELGLLELSENSYKEVETSSVTLKTEVLLQLFSLYIQQGEIEKSVATIKEAIQLNPDYTDVTELAKRYFEDIRDWDSAMELAINEAIRTESLSWFDVLEEYAGLDLTSKQEPSYFNQVLVTLFHIDKYRFERLSAALWNNFHQSDVYFQWLEETNQLLLDHNVEQSHNWKKLPTLYKEAYFYLMSGKFFIKDMSQLMQKHLTNWFMLSADSDRLLSSTAILAWNEHFPEELDAALIDKAEHHLKHSKPTQNARDEGFELLDSIKIWAEKQGLLEGLTTFMQPTLDEWNTENVSPTNIHTLIKDALSYILDQKLEREHVIVEEIAWNEELLKEMQDFHQQLHDMEKEKASTLSNSFRDLKKEFSEKVQTKVPEVLQDCSSLVKEDSDFSNIHAVLNKEMNKQIAQHMENDVLPAFQLAFKEWIVDAEREFQEIQEMYTDFGEKINEQFEEERIASTGDFKVLDDWRRDIERIARGPVRLEEVNILLRNNPSQLLLKGAGKLIGSLSKNKTMLLNRYKEYIKNADYKEVTEQTIKPFIQQLELIEDSIEWDVNRFFSSPQEVLRRTIEEVQATIEEQNDALNKMRENPEIYQDPLTLFEIKRRQYELMHTESMINN